MSEIKTDTSRFKEMLDAGVHFGHLTRKWNPYMEPYIFDSKKGIHILEAKSILEENIKPTGMPYVTERWSGGMLTNFATVRKAIRKMANIDKMQADGTLNNLSKRERLQVARQRAKLERDLGGIAELTRLPSAIFIVDINKENIALAEAKKLNITTFAMVDTNSDPTKVDFPIPSNDDAQKSIAVVLEKISASIQEGLEERKVAKEKQAAEKEKQAKAKKKAKEEKEAKAKAEKEEKEKAKKEEKSDSDSAKASSDASDKASSGKDDKAKSEKSAGSKTEKANKAKGSKDDSDKSSDSKTSAKKEGDKSVAIDSKKDEDGNVLKEQDEPNK
jgi:small subunit ribosomal protein S2